MTSVQEGDKMKIGAFLSSFGLGVEDSFKKCKELGLDGV
jgi:hypothetical protein